jgi:methylenetetrahydrofolate reductase (NADPH)
MHVTEHYSRAKEPIISFEVIPPKRGGSAKQLFDTLDQLVDFRPAFINITSHAAQTFIEELPNGPVKRKIRRKRPGTIGLSAAILQCYGIDPVPHLLCSGFTREETEDALIELNYLGIHNIMALRGDQDHLETHNTPYIKSNEYAVNLVDQISSMNQGIYIDQIQDADPCNFCIGVAGYPEKHIDAPTFEFDLMKLKDKVDRGAEYVITQMFFDNAHYFRFVESAREAGITVPIIPGLKVLTNVRQIATLPQHFNLEIPIDLSQEVEKNPDRAQRIGIEWATQQSKELLDNGVPGIHFYVMSNPLPAKTVLQGLPLFTSIIY